VSVATHWGAVLAARAAGELHITLLQLALLLLLLLLKTIPRSFLVSCVLWMGG
jgi:hypothetical protein